MNTQNFNQLGGFPLETDTLNWLQEAYSIFNALGDVIGNHTIISGCVVDGTTIGDGVVFVDGEIFKFVGGDIQTNVRILENITNKVFENGDDRPVHFERFISFASGVDSIPWANFKRPVSLINLSSRILPAGTNPQLFTGAINAIPEGWQLCDGSNSTPDLRGRFIVGYNADLPDYDAIGKTGGEKEVTLTEAQLASHGHNGSTNSAGAHTHTINADGGSTNSSGNQVRRETDNNGTVSTNSAGAHTHTLNINNAGGDQAHENRPPYYTLAYIIYTGN